MMFLKGYRYMLVNVLCVQNKMPLMLLYLVTVLAILKTCISCIKHWLKILDMQDDRFVKKCYIMLLKDDSNGKVNGATGVRKCLYSVGLGNVWKRQGVDNPNCFVRFLPS